MAGMRLVVEQIWLTSEKKKNLLSGKTAAWAILAQCFLGEEQKDEEDMAWV